MTSRQLEILQHSLGLDQYGQGRMYRNHFCAGEDDEPVCRELIALGYMRQHATTDWLPYFNCSVTEAGKTAVLRESPKAPKLTRSQKRYRRFLGWTEQCKDGTKMGVGMPEYLLIFRKPQTDTTKSYADTPVVKLKRKYSRSRWQIDAHGFTRSSGDRLLTPAELENLPHHTIFKIFREYSLNSVYDFEHHVKLGEALEVKGILPVTFMLLQPQSWHPDVWTDITRMRTLNGAQSAKGREMHLCPMQLDLADRVIEQYSQEGELIFDPFAGLMSVPYRAILKGRRAIGIELSSRYFLDGCSYVEAAAREQKMPGLFDTLEPEDEPLPEEIAATA